MRLWGWEWWKIVDIQIFIRADWDELWVGVIKQVRVYIAQTRKLQIWDKMAWRHWNKWVVSTIVPKEDMPFLEDGTPIDVILNPLWVASRMNIWQIFETHLGWAAAHLGMKFATPALNWIKSEQLEQIMDDAWVTWRVQLMDWRTGEPFNFKATVWVKYMLKLWHLVEDKIHARSVGPYSLVTQQPLWGKAQHGWQRFWEMEVWALEWYWAAHTLQEMLTIKSDDVMWRARAYEDIVKWSKIRHPSIPESFSVLVHELKWLCLNVELVDVHKDWWVEVEDHIELETLDWVISDDWIMEQDQIEELKVADGESEQDIVDGIMDEVNWLSMEEEMTSDIKELEA